jgi:hypothetical protein
MAETKKLKRLKAIRNSHRNVVNNLLQEANELICVDSLSENQKGRIEVISTLFENKLKTLNEIDQEILNVCELTTINNEIQESEEIVARIIDCQRRIKEMKQKQQEMKQKQQSPAINVNTEVEANAQTITSNSQPQVGQGYAKIRLPKLTMPRFKGELTKLNTFWDSFNASIHENDDISTINKFNYLNSLLHGRKRSSRNSRPAFDRVEL